MRHSWIKRGLLVYTKLLSSPTYNSVHQSMSITNSSLSSYSVVKKLFSTDAKTTVTNNGTSESSLISRSKIINEHFDLSEKLKRNEQMRTDTVNSMLLYPNFITPEEEDSLMKELEPYISRLHYETSHWDDAIHDYRETEWSRWTKNNEKILNRVRNIAFPPQVAQMKMVHVLDLAKKGKIKPHIDSTRFCGDTIGGLSLLSSSIMRLVHEDDKEIRCDVLLPRYSLYVMSGLVRFKFTHEVLGEEESNFKGEIVPRDRRISVICRNEPAVSQIDNIFDNAKKLE